MESQESKNRIKMILPSMSPIDLNNVLEVNGVNLFEKLTVSKVTITVDPGTTNKMVLECILGNGIEMDIPADIQLDIVNYRDFDIEKSSKEMEARRSWVVQAQALLSETLGVEFKALDLKPKHWYKDTLTEIFQLNNILLSKNAAQLLGYPLEDNTPGTRAKRELRRDEAKRLLDTAALLELEK